MLEDAEIFVSVVESKSFAKAARKLQLSPSVVTRHITKLEEQLQARLFQRNTRQVSITDAGALFYESCVSILQTYKSSLKQIKSLSDDLVGTLKIGMPASITVLFIKHINSFRTTYPNLKLEIINGNHLINLLNEGFDLIVHCGDLADSSFFCKKLGSWEKITCAAPDYLSLAGIPLKPQDLVQYKCLDHFDNQSREWKYNVDSIIESIKIIPEVRVNSSQDLKNLALAGLGIVYLPSFTVGKELKQGQLIEILVENKVPPLNIYAVYPAVRYLSRRAKVFINFLLDIQEFMA